MQRPSACARLTSRAREYANPPPARTSAAMAAHRTNFLFIAMSPVWRAKELGAYHETRVPALGVSESSARLPGAASRLRLAKAPTAAIFIACAPRARA